LIILHDSDGNSGPLTDADGFLARIRTGEKDAWQGETGQVGLEHRGRAGSAWLFLSRVAEDRILVFSQRPSGEKIYAVDAQGQAGKEREHLLAGRVVRIADADLISAAEAVDAARYFVNEDGLLTPIVHWRRNGEPYWPDFG
jgi:hypothetical protein